MVTFFEFLFFPTTADVVFKQPLISYFVISNFKKVFEDERRGIEDGEEKKEVDIQFLYVLHIIEILQRRAFLEEKSYKRSITGKLHWLEINFSLRLSIYERSKSGQYFWLYRICCGNLWNCFKYQFLYLLRNSSFKQHSRNQSFRDSLSSPPFQVIQCFPS